MFFSRSSKIEEFESTALPHLNELFRTARRMAVDRNDAEDMVQEAFLQAWKSFHRFETGTNCRAWLHKILFHVIQHRRRKWFNLNLVKESEEILKETLAYEPPVPEHLSDEDVLAAFRRIPQKYREVVTLADVEEFSYKEIAETLNIPVGTVMSRLSRGRHMLRGELASVAAEYGIKAAAGGEGA